MFNSDNLRYKNQYTIILNSNKELRKKNRQLHKENRQLKKEIIKNNKDNRNNNCYLCQSIFFKNKKKMDSSYWVRTNDLSVNSRALYQLS